MKYEESYFRKPDNCTFDMQMNTTSMLAICVYSISKLGKWIGE